MLIGVDFDNTIVCYDQLFHTVALEQNLIPPSFPACKSEVRDFLRERNKEDTWTEMQGYIYGKRMVEAKPFPGVVNFFRECHNRDIEVYIVSHRTQRPYLGKQYDLHQAAEEWLGVQGFYDPKGIGLTQNKVYFELTKEKKIERIKTLQCTHFIDDLPEFLGDPSFPEGVERINFVPGDPRVTDERFQRLSSWQDIQESLFRLLKT
ncbi:MAG: methionine salvage enolase-phosphatase E1 [Chlamydiales bacterium]|jgi:methionine salvage enolase-phosphatase E1